MKRILAAMAVSAFLTAGGAWADPARPVVVELYTSQSCGSCVPADQLLARLSKRHDVIALSFAVNYWDILGWKDTMATEAATRRQKAYAAVLGKGGVYTPQMIVDGTIDVVGSRPDDAFSAIGEELMAVTKCEDKHCNRKHPPQPGDVPSAVGIDAVHMDDGTVRIAMAPVPPGTRHFDATVWFFTLRRAVTVKVGGGENQGKTLNYRNVVQDIKAVGKWNGAAAGYTVSYEGLKAAPQDDVVIVVQQGGFGRVLGARLLQAAHK